jgi:hypothetical protein
MPKPSTAFRKRLADERYRKIEFIEDQLRIFQLDLDRLKKTLEEVKIIDSKVYGMPII